MNDKLKEGLEHCRPLAYCDACPYFKDGCYPELHKEALETIIEHEKSIVILTELNQKLLQELEHTTYLLERKENEDEEGRNGEVQLG